jgi:hypothetical protein
MASIKEFCEKYPNEVFTILSLEEMKTCPISFYSENNNRLSNIGMCKFFDKMIGKLYTAYIEIASLQLGTMCTIVECGDKTCKLSGIKNSNYIYCSICNDKPRQGQLEQLCPKITQIKASDLQCSEICNYKIEEDNVIHQIEFFTEKLSGINELFAFMRMHSMSPSLENSQGYLDKLNERHKAQLESRLRKLEEHIHYERGELIQMCMERMEKGEIEPSDEAHNKEAKVDRLNDTIKNLKIEIKFYKHLKDEVI